MSHVHIRVCHVLGCVRVYQDALGWCHLLGCLRVCLRVARGHMSLWQDVSRGKGVVDLIGCEHMGGVCYDVKIDQG